MDCRLLLSGAEAEGSWTDQGVGVARRARIDSPRKLSASHRVSETLVGDMLVIADNGHMDIFVIADNGRDTKRAHQCEPGCEHVIADGPIREQRGLCAPTREA